MGYFNVKVKIEDGTVEIENRLSHDTERYKRDEDNRPYELIVKDILDEPPQKE